VEPDKIAEGEFQIDRHEIVVPPVGLDGILALPVPSRAVVVFAHGSGSSRLSPRNAYVATALNQAGLATLLFDLLTEQEAVDRANVFDIPLLARRLEMARDWAASDQRTCHLPVGYFGASTGAAAALVAASEARDDVFAVVSRGGRPDLAMGTLDRVRAPTLLIVGSLDSQVLALNEAAHEALVCEKALEVVPGATHLFEEPGTLDQVIALTRDWFADHLGSSRTKTDGEIP
jgi:pimeloyl-ACP methyl ester carboxylesterase